MKLAMLLALLTTGCAQRVRVFGAVQPFADQYARNSIVCLPTGLGNLLGAPGWIAFSSDETTNSAANDTAGNVRRFLYNVFALAPAVAGGFVVGTPFLPFSYLGPEDPCHFM